MVEPYRTVFKISPDFDDTYLNLGVGVFACEHPEFEKQCNYWKEYNSDMEMLVNYTRKYAYRPFSNDTNENVLDGRSYFYSRYYFYEA